MPAFSPRGYKNPATTGEINDPAFWKTVGENQDARFVELDANLTGASTDAAKALQTANAYAGQIAQANTTAGSAVAIAQGAESVVRDELQPQVDALNTAAGYAPGDATDAAMANVGSNPDTQFRAVLNAQSVEANADAVTDPVSALTRELMARYVSMPIMYGTGIDRTGATDSTAAMQAFIDARPFQTIYIPEGVYKFTNLNCSAGQVLQGAGRSTARDRYHVFASAGWADNANFGGTVLRATATTGAAVAFLDPDEVTEAYMSGITLIGPGSGSIVGVKYGATTKSLVNPKPTNVVIGNFPIGMTTHNVNEGNFYSPTFRGCQLGLHLENNTNHTSWYGFDAQWCDQGATIGSDSYANTFYSPIFQSNRGIGIQVFGKKNAFYNPYLENNQDGMVFESGAAGNAIDSPFLNDIVDRVWFKAGANENAVTNVGWTGGGSYIRNEGARNYLQGRMPSLVEAGTDTVIIDPLLAGTPFGPWQTYTPALGGTGWALGNATVDASYTRVGKTITIKVFITFGSTTTYGTGGLTVSLPRPMVTRAGFQGAMVKNGVGSFMLFPRVTTSGASVVSMNAIGTNGQGAQTTATHPATWAAGDTLELYGSYHAAS